MASFTKRCSFYCLLTTTLSAARFSLVFIIFPSMYYPSNIETRATTVLVKYVGFWIHISVVELMGFADGSDEGCKRKRNQGRHLKLESE